MHLNHNRGVTTFVHIHLPLPVTKIKNKIEHELNTPSSACNKTEKYQISSNRQSFSGCMYNRTLSCLVKIQYCT